MEDPYNFVDEEDSLAKTTIPTPQQVSGNQPMMMPGNVNGPPQNHQQHPQHQQAMYSTDPQMQNHGYPVMPNNLEKPVKKRGRKKKCDETK